MGLTDWLVSVLLFVAVWLSAAIVSVLSGSLTVGFVYDLQRYLLFFLMVDKMQTGFDIVVLQLPESQSEDPVAVYPYLIFVLSAC